MNILITNDDSVHAPQLLPLIKWSQTKGEVTVVVPKVEQSGKSHSIEIRNPFEIRQEELEPGITVWAVDSTPADCVRFAVSGLKQDFDLCISGINRGYNLGWDAMYSGTLAAASEAAHKGMKALAISTSVKYYDRAVTHLDEIFRFLDEYDLFQNNPLYNINIPVDPKSIRITRQGGPYYSDDFPRVGEHLFRPTGKPVWVSSDDLTLDTDATLSGYITITPLTLDRTHRELFRKLESLNG